MSIAEKLVGSSNKILNVSEVKTQFGEGWEAEVNTGAGVKKKCTIIKDKETGDVVQFGGARECEILRDSLMSVGITTPTTGITQTERIRNPEQ